MGSDGKLHYFPLAIFILFPVTFATTYGIAVGLDHINAFFSYISDTGTLPPEMNIFAQMLNFAMVLMWCTAYIRFNQIEVFFKSRSDYDKVAKYNKLGLIFGGIAGLGSSVVGNFQESNVLSIHVVGAWMAFGGGSIFLIIQAYFSFKLVPLFGTKALATLRMVLGWACLILFVVSFSTGVWSAKLFTGEKMLKWRPEDGGWALRVTSTTTEWIMASLFDLYFLTFIPEFKKIKYTGPKFSFVHTVEKRQNGASQKVVMHRVGADDA